MDKNIVSIDNRMSELSEWDIDLVKAELIDLNDVDFSDVFLDLVDISVDTFDSISPTTASSGFEDISKGADPVDLSHSTGQTETRANTDIKGSDVKIETTSRKWPIKYEVYFDDEGQKSEFMGYLEQIGAIYWSWSTGGNLTEWLATHL